MENNRVRRSQHRDDHVHLRLFNVHRSSRDLLPLESTNSSDYLLFSSAWLSIDAIRSEWYELHSLPAVLRWCSARFPDDDHCLPTGQSVSLRANRTIQAPSNDTSRCLDSSFDRFEDADWISRQISSPQSSTVVRQDTFDHGRRNSRMGWTNTLLCTERTGPRIDHHRQDILFDLLDTSREDGSFVLGKVPYVFAQHLMTGCYSITHLTVHLKFDHGKSARERKSCLREATLWLIRSSSSTLLSAQPDCLSSSCRWSRPWYIEWFVSFGTSP